jgi:hypothetical protein
MKTLPAPNASGETEAERMDNAVRMSFSALKEAFARQETKHRRAQDRKKTGEEDGVKS